VTLGELNPGLVIALVVGLALAPFAAVMVTSFTKIVIVLTLLRNAMGLQQTPPNIVLNGLAIILSIHIMSPVISQMHEAMMDRQAELPGEEITLERITDLGIEAREPLREFLSTHSVTAERRFFVDSARRLMPQDSEATISEQSFMVLIPSFVVAELADAFKIGFLIYLPFLVIDLIVANLLMALGMIMMPPTLVSLPFKLLLFIMLDGWSKLIHGLVLTYV